MDSVLLEEFDEMAWEMACNIARKCTGLPLALQVMGNYVLQKRKDHETITRLEAMRKQLYPNYSLNSGEICIFWESHGYKLLDLDKTTLEAYIAFVDLIRIDGLRLKEHLRMMISCLIVFTFFLSLKLEISDRKAKIQEIKANIRDKYYKGNCKAKIGITPDAGGELKVCIAPFSRWAYCG